MFINITFVVVFLKVSIFQIESKTDNNLVKPILQPTQGKLFFVKFEAKFSYLHHELTLPIFSAQTINVSKTVQV